MMFFRQLDTKAARTAARAAKKEAMRLARAAFDALPAAERWASVERVGMLLHQQAWTFAKTMPQNPHFYTLRKKWAVDAEFVWTVEQIRLQGYKQKYGGSWYTCLDVNDHFYWTMGWPIGDESWGWNRLNAAGTVLINRKPLGASPDSVVPSNAIALSDVDRALAPEVFGRVGDITGLDVLDVGCGTGIALDYTKDAAGYTGIDPSQAMLDRLLVRHPSAHTICTTLRSFVPLASSGEIGRYDRVLALFGKGSYLSDEELERIPILLRTGGRAVVMFYEAGYEPLAGTTVPPHRPWALGLFPGETQKIGHHIICVYEKP